MHLEELENYSKTNSLNNLIEITHIIGSTGVGGVQKNLLSKLKYDKEFNISRKIICINHKDGSLKEEFNKSNIIIDYCLILPEDRNYRPYRLYKRARKIAKLFFGFNFFLKLRKDNSTIIHSEESIKLLTQVLVSLMLGKNFIWQLHTNYDVLGSKWKKRLFLYLISRRKIVFNADSIAAVNANLPQLIDKTHLYNIIAPGIEVEQYVNNNIDKLKLRKKYGLKKKELVIGSTGRLDVSKGFEILIDVVYKIIHDYNINLKLIIAGEGYLRLQLQDKINKLKLKENIILLGCISNIEEYLHVLDIYVQSSLNEGFPLAALEALAAEVPIVSTDAGGLKEMIENDKTGIIVERNNVELLTEGLMLMINKEEKEKKQMIKDGFETANKYSTKASVKKDLAIYSSILDL